jgi:phosphate transport system substrate-binding protein
LASITAAAGASSSGSRTTILNAAGRDAYPISTYTWFLVPAEGLTVEKRAAIVSLLAWMLTSGQKECASLGYAPLPREIADRELHAVNALKNRGQ